MNINKALRICKRELKRQVYNLDHIKWDLKDSWDSANYFMCRDYIIALKTIIDFIEQEVKQQ